MSESSEAARERVLLCGATGFVGRHLTPALEAAGYAVRCASRDPVRAHLRDPVREWVRLDLDERATLEPALEGCGSAIYLVHGMSAGGDYPEREARNARQFCDAAARLDLRRVVYMGGVAPQGEPSQHLGSRLRTGEILRQGDVSTVELRAAMIVGHGSESWLMVRDLARRLPAMILPAWLQNHSWPVAIDDVVAAILAALGFADGHTRWFDVPGPERLSHRELLLRVAAQFSPTPPLMLGVPVLTPRLSSYWIGLVTRAEWAVARELVEGLRHELDPSGAIVWDQLPNHTLVPIDQAIARALADERRNELPSDATIARLQAIGERFLGSRVR